jgi:hypothetical protein
MAYRGRFIGSFREKGRLALLFLGQSPLRGFSLRHAEPSDLFGENGRPRNL